MNRQTFYLLVSIISIFVLSSSASAMPNRFQLFEEVEDQSLPSPSESSAVIVFVLRQDGGDVAGKATSLGLFWNNPVAIYDATTEDLKFLSLIKLNTKVAVEVPAGTYLFMIDHLLSATVEAGKTYFVKVNAVGGVGGELFPVRNGNAGEWQYSAPEFQAELKSTPLINTHPKSIEYWSKKNWVYRTAQKIRKNLIEDWEEASEEERGITSLYADDGIPVGYSIPDAVVQSDTTDNNLIQPEVVKSRDKPIENSLSESCVQKLRSLEGLRTDGIFSEEEFQNQKAELHEQGNC